MTATKIKGLSKELDAAFVATEAEQQHINFFAQINIEAVLVNKTHRLYQLAMPGNPFLRVFSSVKELRASEKTFEKICDKLKAPILMGLPFETFGGSTFIPGTGPIPIFTVKAGALFANWGLSGNCTQSRQALTVKAEMQAAAENQATPYLSFLQQALETKVDVTSETEVQQLMNKAAESPHLLGLPAALEAASGRGTSQGVIMFNPDSKLDTSTSMPTFKRGDWLVFDLGRAIAAETSSSRRAHGIVHQSMIKAMEQEDGLYISYRVNEGVRNQMLKAKKALTNQFS